jgi:hypothetical protein
LSKVADRAHLEAMTNTRRHCVQKENSRKRDGNFLQQDKGAFWFVITQFWVIPQNSLFLNKNKKNKIKKIK